MIWKKFNAKFTLKDENKIFDLIIQDGGNKQINLIRLGYLINFMAKEIYNKV